jgi:hypothetical protein
MARQFDRPAPGNRYSAAERKAWGAAQDAARAARAAQPTPAAKPTAKRASRAKTLVADTSNSSCFDSLVYQDGTVTASFANPTVGVWEYDGFTLAEAREWFNDDSLGGYFNDNVREPPEK